MNDPNRTNSTSHWHTTNSLGLYRRGGNQQLDDSISMNDLPVNLTNSGSTSHVNTTNSQVVEPGGANQELNDSRQ